MGYSNYFCDMVLGGIYLFEQPKQLFKCSTKDLIINHLWPGVCLVFKMYKYVYLSWSCKIRKKIKNTAFGYEGYLWLLVITHVSSYTHSV